MAAKPNVQEHETPEEEIHEPPQNRRLTTDDFILRPVSNILKERAEKWRTEFLVKGVR